MAFQLHGNPTPRTVLARPCSLPATPHRLNTAARPDYDCKGVSPRLCIVARGLPCPLCVPVDIARPVGGSWRTGRMAPHRRECIRLLYAAPGFAGLSLSRSKGFSRAERGARGQIPPGFSSGRNSGWRRSASSRSGGGSPRPLQGRDFRSGHTLCA